MFLQDKELVLDSKDTHSYEFMVRPFTINKKEKKNG